MILYSVGPSMYKEDDIVMNILAKIRFPPSRSTHENLRRQKYAFSFNLKNVTKLYNFVQIAVARFSQCWVNYFCPNSCDHKKGRMIHVVINCVSIS